MKIDFVSDLHVDVWWGKTLPYSVDGPQPRRVDGTSQFVDWEWYRKQSGNDGDVLLIGGDISNNIEDVRSVVNNAAEVYKSVVFVDGNHEHHNGQAYTNNMSQLVDMQSERITFLHTAVPCFVKDDIAFIGANGWYDWRCYEPDFSHNEAYEVWQRGMVDATKILFDDGKPDVLAAKQAEVLAQTVGLIAKSVQKIVMVTHTVPRVDVCVIKHPSWNRSTPSFVNSAMNRVLQAEGAEKIACWLYGHTHARQDIVLDGIRYVNNSVGYPHERVGGTYLKQIEV
jgi:predicted phosphodiesterase